MPKVAEIQIHHVCPDWATPCRHEIAALLQPLKECEDDPNVILKWRGIEVESESVDEEAPIKNDKAITSRKKYNPATAGYHAGKIHKSQRRKEQ